MGSDVGQIFPTASLHRDHSISYALVCEKGKSASWDQLLASFGPMLAYHIVRDQSFAC